MEAVAFGVSDIPNRAGRWWRLSRLFVWLTLAGTAIASLVVVYVYSHRHELGLAPRGVLIFALIGIIPIVPLLLSERERAYRVALSLVTLVLFAIVILGGFSVGHLYLPAACSALTSLVLAFLGRMQQRAPEMAELNR
jgi:hypothetical protein